MTATFEPHATATASGIRPRRPLSLTRLPPLSALRTFLVTARHQSFVQAAGELNVTPAAVGQQIRQLEAHLGCTLFHRGTRTLTLTEQGRALQPGLADGFQRIVEAVSLVSGPAPAEPLVVSMAPSFATKWLIPRLESFRQENPSVDVRIVASMELMNLSAEEADCAIRYGAGRYPGLTVEKLLGEAVFPVCSPALLEGPHGLETPHRLRHHTLLHDDSPEEDASCPDWRMWLRAAGVTGVNPGQGLHFNQSAMVLEAAAAGQGVALAKARLADADLRAGRLVRPFGRVQHVHFAYYFVCTAEKAADPRVDCFRSWLFAHCARARPAGDTAEV